MNLHDKSLRDKTIAAPEVTTGPLAGSRKVHSSPKGHADLRVPFRAIELSNGGSFQVYDSSGPYTDDDAAIDVKRGLPSLRKPWIEARGGVEAYEGREVKPEDNANASLEAFQTVLF